MTAGNGRFPRVHPVALQDIDANLRAVIEQLDDAGQMLAAAYAELALGALRALPFRPSQSAGDPADRL